MRHHSSAVSLFGSAAPVPLSKLLRVLVQLGLRNSRHCRGVAWTVCISERGGQFSPIFIEKMGEMQSVPAPLPALSGSGRRDKSTCMERVDDGDTPWLLPLGVSLGQSFEVSQRPGALP